MKYPENASVYEHFCRNVCTSIVCTYESVPFRSTTVFLSSFWSVFLLSFSKEGRKMRKEKSLNFRKIPVLHKYQIKIEHLYKLQFISKLFKNKYYLIVKFHFYAFCFFTIYKKYIIIIISAI